MKKKLTRIALTLMAGLAAVHVLQADPGCRNQDLTGVYGMFATGTIVVVSPPIVPTGPFARVGRVVADGKGNISVSNTASYDGTIITESYNGTYAVSSDCSVVIVPVVPLPTLGPVPFEFIGALAGGGREAAVVACGLGPGVPCTFPQSSPPGNVIRVLLTRQDSNVKSTCETKDLSGGFLLDMSGTVVTTAGGPVAGPFARDGQLVFDGKGGVTGHATANYSGFVVEAEAPAGTYSVDSLCNLTIHYGPTATSQTWTGTLTNGSNAANLIVADAGVVITGTLKAQTSRDSEN